jgi:serine/threonine-protein kinase
MPSLSRIIFVDIIGFSKKPSHTQKLLIQELTELVCKVSLIDELAKDDCIELPTGDGMAIAVWGEPDLPLKIAIELQKNILNYNLNCPPSLKIEVRTGLNTGEIFTMTDINLQRNIVGEGINNAQRIMDFGDAGHILVSKVLAEEVLVSIPAYTPMLHNLGIFLDKHGVGHHIYNFFDWHIGNAVLPTHNCKADEDSEPEIHFWKKLYELAHWEANFLRYPLIDCRHVILGLTKLENSKIQQFFLSQGCDPTETRRKMRKIIGRGNSGSIQEIKFSKALRECLENTWKKASSDCRDICEADLVRSVFEGSESESLYQIFASLNLKVENLIEFLSAGEEESFASCVISDLPSKISMQQDIPERYLSLESGKKIFSATQAVRNDLTQAVDGIFQGDEIKVSLIVENGPQQGKTFDFLEPEIFIVGRSPHANFVLDKSDPCISRKHFMIEIVPPRCYIKDFASLNGTFVNDEKCSRAELKDGDMVSAGRTRFRVKIIHKEKRHSGKVCSRCKNLFENTRGFEEDSICRACKAEIELEQKDKFARTKVPVEASCIDCGVNLGQEAGSDGRGNFLADVAIYKCRECVEKQFSGFNKHSTGPYRLLKQLGQGGMGSVYLVWNSVSCRLGALKKISLPDPDEKVAGRFLREMHIMSQLNHPNLVRIFEDGIDDKAPYFVSEYLEMGCLKSFLQNKGGKLAIPEALQLTCNVLEGLEYFHNQGYIHRDIKPSNILLSQENGAFKVKIADFGLAKSFIKAGGTVLTRADEFAGSLYYTPPEQIINFSRVGPAADIYSSGVSLYQMISGMLPYNFSSLRGSGSLKDSLLVILEEPIIPIRERNAEIPAKLANIIETAIARKAEDRFSSAKEFKSALTSYLSDLS